MQKILLIAGIAVSLAVSTAGCGGGGDSSPVSDTSLTAAEWRKEANAVCRDIGRKVRKEPLPQAESEIAAFVVAVIPLWKREEDGIRALTPPAELDAAARELADALGYVNVALLEIHIATQRNDGFRRFDAVRQGRGAVRHVKLKARALGLQACAKQRIP